MVKKSRKSGSRKSNDQLTIQQGRQFIYNRSRRSFRNASSVAGTQSNFVRGSSGLRTRLRIRKPIKIANTRNRRVARKNQARKNRSRRALLVPSRPVATVPAKITKPHPSAIISAASVSAHSTSILPVAPVSSAPKSSLLNTNVVGKVSKLNKSKSKDVQIPAFGFIDVCFCIDSTGSMSGQLAQAQEVIKSIISNIESKVRTQGLQLRFAIVSYRDHPPQESTYVTKHLDFTDQYEAIQYLKTLSAMGGGDEPEAAHDGLLVSAKNLNWAEVAGTPVLRYIFHIADAAPHGKQFNSYQSQQGCLCGLRTDDIIREINKKSIHYRLIKARANSNMNQMEKIFKEKIGDFDCTDIKNAQQLNVKVSDMIIHEVLPDYA